MLSLNLKNCRNFLCNRYEYCLEYETTEEISENFIHSIPKKILLETRKENARFY